MASAASLNKRLLLAILREPRSTAPPLSVCSWSTKTPKNWVRSITSKANQHHNEPSISFGDEADAALANYLRKKSAPDSSKPWESRTDVNSRLAQDVNKTKETLLSSVVADDYEISDYIDRSTPLKQRHTRKMSNVEGEAASQSAANLLSNEVKGRKILRTGKTGSENSTTMHGGVEKAELPRRKLEPWMTQRNVLKEKFPDGWNPRKKLSPDAMEGIRGLHQQDPLKYSTSVLAEQFQTSPEAVRRILKSKWMTKQPPEKMAERRERWAKRHDRIWDQQAELGLRPRRQKDAVAEDPDKFEHDLERKRILGEI